MALTLEVQRLLLLGLGLVQAPTVVSPLIIPLSQAHPVTMAPQMSMGLAQGITLSSPPLVSLAALLAVQAASHSVKKRPTTF